MKPESKSTEPLVSSDKPATAQFGQVSESVWRVSGKTMTIDAFIEDLRWLGIQWSEGPGVGGPFTPYSQSERRDLYLDTWRKLRDGGFIYPCICSRKDLAQAASGKSS